MSHFRPALSVAFVLVLLLQPILVVQATPQAITTVASQSEAATPDLAVWQIPITTTLQLAPEPLTGPIELQMRSGAFDPLGVEPTIPDSLRRAPAAADEPSLYLVQFPGPIQGEWVDGLLKAGLEIVTYMPDFAYLVWGKSSAMADTQLPARWWGAYHPYYALQPQLRTATGDVDVVVQVYDHAAVDSTLQAIAEQSKVLRDAYPVLVYRNLKVSVKADLLPWLAALPAVVNVEAAPVYERNDEIQGQIMAGNLNGTGTQPAGAGYLAWLTSLGFPATADSYPVIDITDDGLDNGTATPTHADFWTLGSTANPDRMAYNYNWTTDPLADGAAGHGNLNASIAVGYNNQTGFPYEDTTGDTAGYNFGLGINPFGRVAGSKVFNNAGLWDTTASNTDLIANSYAAGARITSNSWGCGSPYCTNAPYTTDSQEYDALVRDAQPGTVTGNQPMFVVFAAGNDGSSASTIGSPATAKNVMTVGGAENYRATATDGCNVAATLADNAQDILTSSSRGPTADNRTKPDIMAPSTHIMGAASQAAGYDGSGVCGSLTAPQDYFPTGQTLYTWSSGTSHSTPAVAGAASLVYRYYQDHFGGAAPSPAMLKAYLLNSARYLTGLGGSGNLPTTAQGFGEVYLGRAFDTTPRFVIDQSHVFAGSGEVLQLQGSVVSTTQPVRVTLAWTDAPGPTSGSAYINNLDLTVSVNGSTYRGNVFSGQNSATGGSADLRNNVESVFVPAGVSGNMIITVTATNIAGDGVPGNADLTDQDFALVVYNAASGALAGTVSNSVNGQPIAGATLQLSATSLSTTSNGSGDYAFNPIVAGTYTLLASAYGYQARSISGINVGAGTTTQAVALTPITTFHTVSGVVRDAITGWPLYANVAIPGYPGGGVWTDPVTGAYSVQLPDAVAYTFNVSAWTSGYQAASRVVTATGNRTENFDLSIDRFACSAPGYQKTTTAVTGSSTGFEGTTGTALPTGWSVTVVTNTTGTAPAWAGSGNGTNPTVVPHGGTRQAYFNSWLAESGDGARLFRATGENLSAATNVQVSVWVYRHGGNGTVWDTRADYLQVQASTTGIASWTNVGAPIYRYDPSLAVNTGQWRQYTIDLSQFAGNSSVRVAILGVSDYGYNIYIDDIAMSTFTCAPQPGGLVVGNVYDAAALSGLSGATVSRSGGGSTTTAAGGFYALFSPSGSGTFTAALAGYTSGVTTTNVVQSTTQRVDFYLNFITTGYVWTGNTSTNWFVGSNWSPAGVPATTASVVVPTNPAGARWPIVTGTSTIYSLTVQAGAVITLEQTGRLNANGVVHHYGQLSQIKDAPLGATTEFVRITDAAGSVDKYRGVDVTPTGGALGVTTVQVKGNQTACTNNATDPIVLRCFQISPAAAAAAQVRFWYSEAERNGQAANALKLWHFSPWAQTGTNYQYSETGSPCVSGGGQLCWFQISDVTAFSPFALGSSTAPTAVTLSQLRATANGAGWPWWLAVVGVSGTIGWVVRRRRA